MKKRNLRFSLDCVSLVLSIVAYFDCSLPLLIKQSLWLEYKYIGSSHCGFIALTLPVMSKTWLAPFNDIETQTSLRPNRV